MQRLKMDQKDPQLLSENGFKEANGIDCAQLWQLADYNATWDSSYVMSFGEFTYTNDSLILT